VSAAHAGPSSAAAQAGSGPSVVVVGGGVIGLSAARQLASRGADVTLVSAGNLLDGASGRSLSWLNSAGQRSAEYHDLRLAGIDRYRRLATSLVSTEDTADPDRVSDHLRFGGGFTWAADGASYAARHGHETAIGYSSLWVEKADVARTVPGVDPGSVAEEGGILNSEEGWIDLPWLGLHLARGLVRDGGRILVGQGVWEPVLSGSRAVGVRSAAGTRVDADQVLLASGAGTPGLLAGLGENAVRVPEATSTAMLLRVVPALPDGGRHPLDAVLNTPRVGVRPAPGGTFVMDSDWASDLVEGGGGRPYTVAPEVPRQLVDEAQAVLAGHPRLEILSLGIGPKPMPGDGDPVLGPVPGVEGLSVAFTHSGATLALIAGELLAEEITTGTPREELASFRVERFG
jgi:glycine/D-amino acid oxidase-like deaminating enzyme